MDPRLFLSATRQSKLLKIMICNRGMDRNDFCRLGRLRYFQGNCSTASQIERGLGGFTESTRIFIQIDPLISARSVQSAFYSGQPE
jgi:hypothetical protein